MLVDSHCHLDFPEFGPELDIVISRARSAGVGHFLTIGTTLKRFAALFPKIPGAPRPAVMNELTTLDFGPLFGPAGGVQIELLAFLLADTLHRNFRRRRLFVRTCVRDDVENVHDRDNARFHWDRFARESIIAAPVPPFMVKFCNCFGHLKNREIAS